MKNIFGNPITTTILAIVIVGILVYMLKSKQTINMATGEITSAFSLKSAPKK